MRCSARDCRSTLALGCVRRLRDGKRLCPCSTAKPWLRHGRWQLLQLPFCRPLAPVLAQKLLCTRVQCQVHRVLAPANSEVFICFGLTQHPQLKIKYSGWSLEGYTWHKTHLISSITALGMLALAALSNQIQRPSDMARLARLPSRRSPLRCWARWAQRA